MAPVCECVRASLDCTSANSLALAPPHESHIDTTLLRASHPQCSSSNKLTVVGSGSRSHHLTTPVDMITKIREKSTDSLSPRWPDHTRPSTPKQTPPHTVERVSRNYDRKRSNQSGQHICASAFRPCMVVVGGPFVPGGLSLLHVGQLADSQKKRGTSFLAYSLRDRGSQHVSDGW